MLSFRSASVRIANSKRAVEECLDILYEGDSPSSGIVIVNAAIGHKLASIAEALHEQSPSLTVLGTSCGGVVGREGAGEALSHIAMMTIEGPAQELAWAGADDVHRHNAYAKGLALAQELKQKLPDVHIIYLICPGLDMSNDDVLLAFQEVFGDEVDIFGGTSADNYKAIATYQYLDDHQTEHGIWAVGLADPTLSAVTKATHGFTAYGEPMIITKAEGGFIEEIDHLPAWAAYMKRLNMIPEKDPLLTVIATGALALELPPELAEEYGNPHILRGAIPGEREGVMYMAVKCPVGTKLWLTTRDEELIFSEQDKALSYMKEQLRGNAPVAVFQADCLARGRTLFNRVMKDELISMMQEALSSDGDVPPWLGMYGFGEYARLGGKNTFHTYTTSLMALYRAQKA